MKLIRKFTLISFGLIIVLLLMGNINVNGVTEEGYKSSDQITVVGGGIRTSGNQGIRFKCKNEYTRANTLEFNYEIKEYGAWIVFGSKDSNGNQLTSDVIATAYENNAKINNHSIMDAYVTETDEDGIYYVTVYNIPDDCYLQDITVVPYVNVYRNSPYTTECIFKCEVVYGSTALSRNIGEIALAFLNDSGLPSTAGTIIPDVVEKIDEDYRKQFKDSLGNLYLDSVVYESNPEYIFNEFVKDWNKYFVMNSSVQITTDISITDFVNKLKPASTNTQDSNLVNFFWEYNYKYSSILELMKTFNNKLNLDIDIEIDYLNDPSHSVPFNDECCAQDFLYFFYGFLKQCDTSSYWVSGYNFSLGQNRGIYQLLSSKNTTVFTNLLDDDRDLDIVNIIYSTTLDEITATTGNYARWGSYEFNRDGSNSVIEHEYYDNSEFNVLNNKYYFFYPKETTKADKVTLLSDLSGESLDISTSYYTLNGNGHGLSSLTSLSIDQKVEEITIKNVTIDNTSITHTILDSGDQGCSIRNITFENCIFINHTGSYINWTELSNTYNCDINFKDCTFNSDGTDYCVIINNNKNITFTNCIFSGATSGAIKLTGYETGNVLIDNCTFSNCGGNFIYVEYLCNHDGATITIKNGSYQGSIGTDTILYVSGVDDVESYAEFIKFVNVSYTSESGIEYLGRTSYEQSIYCYVDGVMKEINNGGVYSIPE